MSKKQLIFLLFTIFVFILSGCSINKKIHNNSAHKSSSKIIRKKQPNAIDTKIKHMSLDQKIGQLYLSPVTSSTKIDLKTYHLGGICLFAQDFENQTKPQFIQKINSFQNDSDNGLFIATDQEGGSVSRLSANGALTNNRSFLSPLDIYNKSGFIGVKKEDTEVAQILYNLGINWNFAPVADVSLNKNSFIYPRTIGQNYAVTSKYIKTAIKAYQDNNIACSIKHFPGYGDSADTHNDFAMNQKPLKQYETQDLLPFKAGIDIGVDSIMVSHIIISSIDNKNPASLSPAVHNLLTQKLHYHGIIITDDLQMGAITKFASQNKINPDVLALQAGNDVLLSDSYKTGIPAIKKAITSKQLSESQINERVKKVLLLKQKLGILK